MLNAGWSRVPLADGGVLLTGPAGAISILPGLRPLLPLRTIVARIQTQARPALRGAVPLGPVEPIVTDEGEYAALVELEAGPLRWAVGVIAGDDSYTLFDGTGSGPEIRAEVEGLVRSATPGVASLRVRMFPYRPPAGWLGVRGPLATCWCAPGRRARLVVCDAVPLRSPAVLTQDLIWPLGDGTLVQRDDGRFVYRVFLRGGTADDQAILHAVAASIEPIAASRAPVAREVFAWLT